MTLSPHHFSFYTNDIIMSSYIGTQMGKMPTVIYLDDVTLEALSSLDESFETIIDYTTSFSRESSPFGGTIQKRLCILPSLNAYVYFSNCREFPSPTYYCHVYYNGDKGKPEEVIAHLKKYISTSKTAENHISLIILKGNELDTKEFEIKVGPLDISSNYGTAFVPKYNKIMGTLNQSEGKGIILLHGEPGTGKTSLIKHIAKNLTKKVIFIPPSMSGSLSNPEFLGFMMKHPNCILIIEDAEKVVSMRDGGKSDRAGVSNILNMSDGILGDCLNIQIIASFNTKREEIDSALLRKGRLIAEHEFGPLSIEDSQKLLTKLGKDCAIATKPMTLTEIYNCDEVELKSVKERAKIGFAY